jgi:hypothetical protein
MGVQAAAIAMIALGTTFAAWAIAAVLLGAYTAMVYPTLLAAIGDVAHPPGGPVDGVPAAARRRVRRRRSAGRRVIADAFGIPAAIWVVAASLPPPASSSPSARTRPGQRRPAG